MIKSNHLLVFFGFVSQIGIKVLVATTRDGEHYNVVLLELMADLGKESQGMSRLEGRNDTLHTRELKSSTERLIIVGRKNLCTTCLVEVAVDRARTRIVKAC